MKRLPIACLILLSATLLFSQSNLAQSNPSQLLDHSASLAPPAVSPAHPPQPDPKAQARILSQYGKLPLTFEPNQGQTAAPVKFLSRTPAYTLYLTGDEAVLTLPAKTAKPAAKKLTSPVETRLAASGPRASRLAPRNSALTLGGAALQRCDKCIVSNPALAAAVTLSTRESLLPQPAKGASAPAPALRMKLRHANPAATITGVDQLPSTTNYFLGNDPTKWHTSIPTYSKVKYEQIYSGIDLVYYGNQRQLEYDFIVAPGANPHRIAFDITGANQIRQSPQGELIFKLAKREIRWHKPVVYQEQEKDGTRHQIAAHYSLTNKNRVTFELARYDTTKPLYIDPIIDPLIYSTYLGGSGYDFGYGIAVDSTGNAYVTGITTSTDFPVTPGAFQTTSGGSWNAFVTKFSPAGSALAYSTYLGGSGNAEGWAITADGVGNAYVTGAASSDFPTTPGAFQTACDSCSTSDDAFVAKLNPTGSSLVYSTYLGGSGQDEGQGIAVDAAGSAYIIGPTASTNFPTTPDAFQTVCGGTCVGNAFVTKFNSTGSALVYSTYLGGSGGSYSSDQGYGIAVNTSGNAYVTGSTSSVDFPVTPGAFQRVCGGTCVGNAFVTEFNPTGTVLVYSTFLGGSGGDEGYGIAVDDAGDAYVAGLTLSTDFPVTPGAFQTTCNEGGYCEDAFVSKLNPEGSALAYSTFLGGSGAALSYSVAVDSMGDAYVTGSAGAGFPTTPGAFQTKLGGRHGDAFVTKLNSSGSALFYSTYLGGSERGRPPATVGTGIAVDSAGNTYVTGRTAATVFPTTPGAFQTAYGGGNDAFMTNMHIPAVTTTTALSSAPNPSTYGQPVTFIAAVASNAGAPPDGETVSFMRGKTVLGTGTLSSGSATFTTSTLKVGTATVAAVYAGDSNFASSKSKPLKQVVNKAAN